MMILTIVILWSLQWWYDGDTFSGLIESCNTAESSKATNSWAVHSTPLERPRAGTLRRHLMASVLGLVRCHILPEKMWIPSSQLNIYNWHHSEKSPYFYWENSLFLWPSSIAILTEPEGSFKTVCLRRAIMSDLRRQHLVVAIWATVCCKTD